MTTPADLPLREAAARLRDGSLTAVELARSHFERIKERDGRTGAFVHIDPDAVLSAAAIADDELAAGDDRGPLHGIPFAVKDMIDVAGWPVRFGSRLFGERIAPADSIVVARLRQAGAIPLGLVATYELGVAGPSDDGLYRQPRNPWNIGCITGGSSSGCAAALSAGLVRIAVGSDTGGSVRSPAAYCGVVGLKPTRGRVPADGCLPLAPSMEGPGAMGRKVSETALLFAAMAGEDHAEPGADLHGIRIGYAREWCRSTDHPGIIAATDAAASDLSLCGARVTQCALPDLELMMSVGAVLIHAEGFRTHRQLLGGDGGMMGRMAFQSLAAGAVISDEDIAQASRASEILARDVDNLFGEVDALVMATTLSTAPPFSDFADGQSVWTPMCTLPFNVTGHPALSVPMGFLQGLPLGLQIVGRRGEESTVLRIAAAFERATDHGAFDAFTTAPSIPRPAPTAEEFA